MELMVQCGDGGLAQQQHELLLIWMEPKTQTLRDRQ